MAPRRRTLAGFIILALAVLPRVAHAQAAGADGGQAWPTVDAVAPSTKIVVTLKTGEKWIGNFRRASTDDVTIAVRPKGQQPAKEETLPKSLIATVATAPDPVWNGALVGAGVGTGLAMWDYLIDPSEPGNAAVFTVAIGLGTAIGAGIDALVNRRGKVLYAASRHTASLTVSPSLARDRRGVLVSIRF